MEVKGQFFLSRWRDKNLVNIPEHWPDDWEKATLLFLSVHIVCHTGSIDFL